MTADEKLDLLLSEFTSFKGEINTRLDNIETNVANLRTNVSEVKSEVADLKADVSGLKAEVSALKSEVSDLKLNVSVLEVNVSALQTAQVQTRATLENTVDKCVQVLHEGYTLNAERLDKFDIEAIKRNTELAVALAKIAYNTNEKKAV